jgi:hypothetical protein
MLSRIEYSEHISVILVKGIGENLNPHVTAHVSGPVVIITLAYEVEDTGFKT